MPFAIMKYCPTSRSLQTVGEAEPDTEFHITLDTYRWRHTHLLLACMNKLLPLVITIIYLLPWVTQKQRQQPITPVYE